MVSHFVSAGASGLILVFANRYNNHLEVHQRKHHWIAKRGGELLNELHDIGYESFQEKYKNLGYNQLRKFIYNNENWFKVIKEAQNKFEDSGEYEGIGRKDKASKYLSRTYIGAATLITTILIAQTYLTWYDPAYKKDNIIEESNPSNRNNLMAPEQPQMPGL